MRGFSRWIIISFLLLVLCSCGAVTPGPVGDPTSPPLPNPTAVPATSEPTEIPPASEPTPISYSPELWKDWPEYRNDEYGFAFQYPPDWQVELDQREDSTSTGHLLWLKSPHQPMTVPSSGFTSADEGYGIRRTGMGLGDIIQRGTIVFLGEPVRRDFLVALGKDMALLYNSAGLIQRGDLVFTLGLDYQGGYDSPTALSGAIENETDTILVSFRLVDQFSSPSPTSIPPTPVPSSSPPAEGAGAVDWVNSGLELGLGWGLALGDLNGDQYPDAVVFGEEVTIWLNDGAGGFASTGQPLGKGMWGTLGDVDGDGDLDLLSVTGGSPVRLLLNDGTGSFMDSGQQLGTTTSWTVALGDLDGDGDLDAWIADQGPDGVWLNDGNGVFTDSGQSFGTTYTGAVALGDLDGDGDLDAVVGGWDEPARVWLNDGTGIFADSGQALLPGNAHVHCIALGDLNGDGHLDAAMALAGAIKGARVFLNDGQAKLSDSGQALNGTLAHGIALGDIDGDGDLDMATAHGSAPKGADQGVKVWQNDGTGKFTSAGPLLGQAFSCSTALSDLDRDGDLDIVATHGDQPRPAEVWWN